MLMSQERVLICFCGGEKKNVLTSFGSEVVESLPHPQGLVENMGTLLPREKPNPTSDLFYQLGGWQEGEKIAGT